jgi:hypothetical protein
MNALIPARKALVALIFSTLLGSAAGCGDAPTTDGKGALTIDITIDHGQVTPANATLQAAVHQPITLHVNSDATDELHVHSVPDHKFEVAATANQTFGFSVDVPGTVDVELHHLDRTVATIHVHP